jgi:hypothetical protein
MAENFLKKKLGPQPAWLWGLEGLFGFFVYRYIRHRQSAQLSGVTSATATPIAGGTIPSSSGQSTSGPPGFSTLAQWEEAALSSIVSPSYGAAPAFNDLSAWLNGNCVTQAGYNAIGQFLISGGLPPGYSIPPALTVCAAPPPPPAPATAPNPNPWGLTAADFAPKTSSNGAPPALGSIVSNVLGNVVSVFPLGTGWVYVTDRGYVYNAGGSPYWGGTEDGTIGGPIASHIVNAIPITSGPNAGGYSLIASNGDTYNFGPAYHVA